MINLLIKEMIMFYDGNIHDIDHFLKVYVYAKTIGESERLNEKEQNILETAAVVHDIACPLCRRKYGSANGYHQEQEGSIMASDFLNKMGYDSNIIKRVCWLVGHHHTINDIQNIDHQILIEADFIVNSHESNLSIDSIRAFYQKYFMTKVGKEIINSIYEL